MRPVSPTAERIGRPSKFTPERRARVLEAITGGATRTAAALHAGIDERTLYRWMDRYVSFASDLTRAEADAELRCTALIQRAAEIDWRAAAWWLERRRPDEYGRRERVDSRVDISNSGVHIYLPARGELSTNGSSTAADVPDAGSA